ncbi:MAG: N-acetylglucosamine-6-phosphate deacetylase [Terriglobales bacterium]
MRRLVCARQMVTPEESYSETGVVIEDGKIQALGRRQELEVASGTRTDDYGDAVLAPGLIDIHVHGGAGVDVMTTEATGIERLRHHLAQHGVTSFVATTMTAPWDKLAAAVERLGSAGLGIHLEGPFLSSERRGVHPEADLLAPRPERLRELWAASGGQIRIITLAPELEGAAELIAEAVKLGIRVSMGHSDATVEQARTAIVEGACHVTHTFNAMRPLHQREPGLLGLALADAELSAEIIADGQHVDPMLVSLFLQVKAEGKAMLVSDGISATGMGDGEYSLGGIEVRVKDGCCRAGGQLAGSVLTLEQAVANVRRWTGWDWARAIRLATLNPASLLGWTSKGRLEVGADADVAVFSPQGKIMATYVAGRLEN